MLKSGRLPVIKMYLSKSSIFYNKCQWVTQTTKVSLTARISNNVLQCFHSGALPLWPLTYDTVISRQIQL